jgi:hypothetical protein
LIADNSFCTIVAAATAAAASANDCGGAEGTPHRLQTLLVKWLNDHLFHCDPGGRDEPAQQSELALSKLHWLRSLRERFHQFPAMGTTKEQHSIPEIVSLIGADQLIFSHSRVSNRSLRTEQVPHPGAGKCFTLDGIVPLSVVDRLVSLCEVLPLAEHQKNKQKPCSDRYYFCDTAGWATTALEKAIRDGLARSLSTSTLTSTTSTAAESSSGVCFVFPHMRFLHYKLAGDCLPPHIDLSRTDKARGITSTHTFILYLREGVDSGGETVLLRYLDEKKDRMLRSAEECAGDGGNELAKVTPIRGRLLLFPHRCPHAGLEVRKPPKLLLRGEVFIPAFK